ncbi:hypothetical protein FQN57_001942 [Myotisia sp. PD_48]|nr:hypothetical protein FQN57_001942 [Myotisia sp. PD_48]
MADPEFGTTDLDDAHLETITFEGRDYQKYAIQNRIYFAPIDDEEIERLELQHKVLNKVFDDRLIFPPVPQPTKVLDCGYGSGAWAVAVADHYPSCEVIGVDITPHMKPDETPENLWLQVDDLNRHFTFQVNQFDLIHSRLVASGLNKERWPRYLRDIVRSLKRGGWVQMVEIYFNVQSDSGVLTEDHALRQWSTKYISALEDIKDVRAGMKLNNFMSSAGLTQIESKMIALPLSGWSNGELQDPPFYYVEIHLIKKDPRLRSIGTDNKANAESFLESLALYPFMHRLNMTRPEVDELVARARQEVNDNSLKAYVPL